MNGGPEHTQGTALGCLQGDTDVVSFQPLDFALRALSPRPAASPIPHAQPRRRCVGRSCGAGDLITAGVRRSGRLELC